MVDEVPIRLTDEQMMEVEAYARQHDKTPEQAASELFGIGLANTIRRNTGPQRRRDS